MGCGANTDCGGKKTTSVKNNKTSIVKVYSPGLPPKNVTIKKKN